MASSWGWPVAVVFALVGLSDGRARAGADAGTADPDARYTQHVSDTVRSHLPEVRACFSVALERNPRLSGRFDAAWTIGDDGKPRDVRFDAVEPVDKEFTACVERTVAAWRFGRTKGPVDIKFPFVFNTTGGTSPVPPAAANPATPVVAKAGVPPVPIPIAASRPGQGRAWETAQKWLAAFARYDADALAQLTTFPLTYRTVGMRRRPCASSSRDAAQLKSWITCLRKANSLIAGELGAPDARVEFDAFQSRDLDEASKGVTGGEWVPAFLNGDGVNFRFRLLVTPATGGASTVKALIVSASFDQG